MDRAAFPPGVWSGSSPMGRCNATWGCSVSYGTCCWPHYAWRGSSPGSPTSCLGSLSVRPADIHDTCRPKYVPGRWLSGDVCLGPRMDTSGRSAVRWGGDQATDQALVTCRPNAAQSVVPGGLRAYTPEAVSLSLGGGGWRIMLEVEPPYRGTASPPPPPPTALDVYPQALMCTHGP